MSTPTIKMLEAKRKSLYSLTQNLYDLSTNLDKPEDVKLFLMRSNTLDDTRIEYMKIIDELNLAKSETNPEFNPSYKYLETYDELICKIRFEQSRLVQEEKLPIKPKNRVQLPSLQLLSFDGNHSKWPLFFENFREIVHNNEHLSEVEKINYLISKLSGTALKTIAGFLPTAENYNIIWNTLTDRFQDKRNLAAHYLNEILKFKTIHTPDTKSLNSFTEHIESAYTALKALQIENLSDVIITHIALNKLDKNTLQTFEHIMRAEKMPRFESLSEFIRTQSKIYNRTDKLNSYEKTPTDIKKPRGFTANLKIKCEFCNGTHQLYHCNQFKILDKERMITFLYKQKICIICLTKHVGKACEKKWRCHRCGEAHNVLICAVTDSQSGGTPTSLTATENAVSLIPTANVFLHSGAKHVIIRAILDTGANSNFITLKTCLENKLKVKTLKTLAFGLGDTSLDIIGYVNLRLSSVINKKIKFNIEAAVIKTITGSIPANEIEKIDEFKGIKLADRKFFKPGGIDCILGSDIFSQILKNKKIRSAKSSLTAIDTTLGFIILGNSEKAASPLALNAIIPSEEELNETLQALWAVEAVPQKKHLSPEEKACEDNFEKSVIRDKTGVYTISLPFKKDPIVLGDSRKHAEKRFLQLEKKLEKNKDLRHGYNETIKEYLQKGYLNQVTIRPGELAYYIPHRAIYRPDKATSKIRIVLDASCKTTSGYSLNDILYCGPNLQSDIFNLLTNFRLFKVAISADIEKMFFSIRVAEEQRRFQRILYRFDKSDPISTFEFERVPFGLVCSPYLARKVVQRLFCDKDSPSLKATLGSSTYSYMDDYLISVPSSELAERIRAQLVNTFASAGFNLTKWISNDSKFLENISENSRSHSMINVEADSENKLIGLWWDTTRDVLLFKTKRFDATVSCTKRNLLSATAALYDPLGLLAPLTAAMKLIIQECWSLSLGWDEIVPTAIKSRWEKIQNELHLIENLRIHRHLGACEDREINIIGFADASERCYGAVLYMRIGDLREETSIVSLICSKSRVAPLKKISLARLELCAALLLATLVDTVRNELKERIKISNVLAFSDSTITLAWLRASPHKWQTFVANRTATIREIIKPESWYHIPGKLNPSDLISRPPSPKELTESKTWFQGPEWLRMPKAAWPITNTVKLETPEVLPEEKKICLLISKEESSSIIYQLAQRVSSWIKLVNIMVRIFRFLKIIKTRGIIRASERERAENFIFKEIQEKYFESELKQLNSKQENRGKIRKLRPFLSEGIIRVGGRLEHSALEYDTKHPILLPAKDPIVKLLITHTHNVNLHTGPGLLMALLRRKYWILASRGIVRRIVHACNICFRARPRSVKPLMGDLPAYRVNSTIKAFSRVGIDYAGPVYVTLARGRGVRKTKTYICLFVCLATKAIHLELVTDLSTDLFLAAFKRFLARRGPVSLILSDRGSNFVGAKRRLSELYELITSDDYNNVLIRELAIKRIEFKLISPFSPHFGGIWESNVKSVKTHLDRVIGTHLLTYEELNTLLIQIEALLNSRPLCALSEDPSEFEALTPAHFLTIQPLKYLPAPNLHDVSIANTQRFALVDKMVQSYWKRWHLEYLNTLQSREKWNSFSNPIKLGQIVLVNEPNALPLNWPLGRITNVFPGKDNITRVVEVKTKTGVYIRPAVRICPLPTQ